MDGNWPSSSSDQSKGESSKSQPRQSEVSGSDGEDEEDESEPSSLANFRKQWELELKQISATCKNNTPTQMSAVSTAQAHNTPTQFSNVSPATLNSISPRRSSASHTPPVSSASTGQNDDVEEEAKKFFLMGVSFERRGDLYDAVRFYRRAMQLIPDIERRLSLHNEREYEPPVDSTTEMDDDLEPSAEDMESEDKEDDRPLYVKFIQRIEANSWQFFRKLKEDSKCHMSDIPVEVLLYILRWLVSNDLDVRSLDMLANVCRGFYCLSRDEKLWKMACDRVWATCDIRGSEFPSYREMFLNRPRVRFDGCYISRITYVRPGENSYQDASYRPWHFVEYFRYLRFFPDGKLYFLTTAEKPAVTVGCLRDRTARNTTVLKGTYRLFGTNVISASVRKPTVSSAPSQYQGRPGRGSKQPPTQDRTEFPMDFEIEEHKGKKNCVLRWTYYAVYVSSTNMRNNNMNNNNGEPGGGVTTTFELNPVKYPPLHFSRVKSYTLDSEHILE